MPASGTENHAVLADRENALATMLRRVETSAPRAFVIGLLLAAAAIRVGWLLALPNEQVSDSVPLVTLAVNVAHGDGYLLNGQPNTFWPPGYSLFLSMVFRVAESEFLGKLVNVVLSLGIVALTYGVGRCLFDERVGRWSAILVAALPSQIANCGLLRTEVLSLWLLMLAFYLLVRTAGQPSPLTALTIGVTLGAGSLVRPSLLLFPAVIAVVMLLFQVRWTRGLLALLLIAIGQCAVIAPWTVRNFQVLGSFVPISTNGGYNLWIGNNPHATGNYELEIDGKTVHSFSRRQQLLANQNWNAAEADDFFKREAVAYIKQNPGRFVSGAMRKLWYFYALDTDGVNWTLAGTHSGLGATQPVQLAIKLAAQGYYLVMMIAAVLGVWSLARDRGPMRHLSVLLPVLYFSAIHAVIVGDCRYHFPIMPFVCVVAAYGGCKWLDNKQRNRPEMKHAIDQPSEARKRLFLASTRVRRPAWL